MSVVMPHTVQISKSGLCQNEDNLHSTVENILLKCLLNLYFTRNMAGLGNLKISLKTLAMLVKVRMTSF